MTVVFTPVAQNDLSLIWDYTEKTWGVTQAESYTHNLYQACQQLAEAVNPAQSVDFVRTGYQKALCGKHCIFFTTDGATITIVRILHQSMDVEL